MIKYIRVTEPQEVIHLRETTFYKECMSSKGNPDIIFCPEDIYEKVFNTDKIKHLRINNLQLRPAVYLGKEPPFPSWYIDYFYANYLYGRENEYTKEGDYYIENGDLPRLKYHKNCFKNKESCYSIAVFERDSEGYYELHFIGDRPLKLNEADFKDFIKLVKYGYKELNKLNEEDA